MVRDTANSAAPADQAVQCLSMELLQRTTWTRQDAVARGDGDVLCRRTRAANSRTQSPRAVRTRGVESGSGRVIGLADVLVHEPGHLEHVDRGLAAEDRLQGGVGVDHAAILGVLQLVLLDVS